MSTNISSSRFSGQFTPGTPVQSGRLRNNYQQSPPPNSNQSSGSGGGGGGGGGRNKDRGAGGVLMPNDIKIPKPPKQPDKPLPAYMRYSRKVWESVKNVNPDMKMWDIGKLIGEQWRNLPDEERQNYNEEYEMEKVEYQEAMKNYHNSTAYRDWLKAKEKAQQAIQEQQMQEKMIGGTMPKEEPRFQLQQIEDDDEEAEFSVKHVATSRFQRNHRLILEILGDTIVPDIKTIVTRPRHENLKRQVQSLMQHQRKLESEIQVMEENFNMTKKLILDRSAKFEENIKKYTGPLPPLKIDEDAANSPGPAETPLVDPIEELGSPVLPRVRELIPAENGPLKDPVPMETETSVSSISEQTSTNTATITLAEAGITSTETSSSLSSNDSSTGSHTSIDSTVLSPEAPSTAPPSITSAVSTYPSTVTGILSPAVPIVASYASPTSAFQSAGPMSVSTCPSAGPMSTSTTFPSAGPMSTSTFPSAGPMSTSALPSSAGPMSASALSSAGPMSASALSSAGPMSSSTFPSAVPMTAATPTPAYTYPSTAPTLPTYPSSVNSSSIHHPSVSNTGSIAFESRDINTTAVTPALPTSTLETVATETTSQSETDKNGAIGNNFIENSSTGESCINDSSVNENSISNEPVHETKEEQMDTSENVSVSQPE